MLLVLCGFGVLLVDERGKGASAGDNVSGATAPTQEAPEPDAPPSVSPSLVVTTVASGGD